MRSSTQPPPPESGAALRQSEADLRRLNRLYAVVTGVNEDVLRLREPQALYQRLCQVAVEQGGFRMVWVGLVDFRTDQVRPAAWAGAHADYLEAVTITASGPRGQGPVGAALRELRPDVCNDLEADPRRGPWRTEALARGFLSLAAFPLKVGEDAIGAVGLCAGEVGFFGEAEVRLLEALTADISFALEAAEHERERERAGLALKASEARARALFRGFPLPTYTWQRSGEDFVLADWNRAAEIETQGVIAGWLGRRASDLGEGDPEMLEWVTRTYREQTVLRHERPYRYRTTGVLRDLVFNFAFVPPDLVMIHTEDVTERRRAEAELRQANLELERRVRERTAELAAANEDLAAFSSTVSHDLAAPLRAIEGFAGILKRRHAGGLDEEGRRFLDAIADASARMERLIHDLLIFARLGRQELAAGPVVLGELMRAVASDLAGKIREAGASLHVEGEGLALTADPTLLRQVLGNLVDNAITYRRPEVPPRVLVEAAGQGGSVVLRVSDNGLGIPAAERDRIFEPFTRLHGSDDFPGTGIGLAIVKRAVTRLGGRVGVESRVGEGSVFTVVLPGEPVVT